MFWMVPSRLLFLSTLSLRRATISALWMALSRLLFLSTLSLRRATWAVFLSCSYPLISIHALLAESDVLLFWAYNTVSAFLSTLSLRRATIRKGTAGRINGNFYPRSPCGERRILSIRIIGFLGFLSTLSLRRATQGQNKRCRKSHDFYPRSPCGERPPRGDSCYLDNIISIHALLAESD